ncbi:ABC transporter permease [Saccharopolyspora hordei]|uniref:Oligopeptide transport system permease protein n=1 Tax=Saccharopolyspora hordei TaxID=1838 RepID=A0A853AGC3_9PSEU|nr:ABC transporter permease [Saccharopolyspora hordei]NYI81373.1 oligopeptide transport system permease protein [Saccharopolyspora hordei]
MTEQGTSSLTSEPAPTEPAAAVAEPTGKTEKPRGLWSDAWRDLRRRPIFLASMVIIFVLLVMAFFPQLFTSVDPNHMDLSRSRQEPSAEAWFGYDTQGRDIFARCIYGARASIIVGVMATLLTVLLGSVIGLIAGYFGGWLDSLLSRFGEIFLGLPFVLGAIVILTTLNPATEVPDTFKITSLVILSISILSWPISMRIMRSAAISAVNQDYVKAARALGAGPVRIILRHMLPNCLAPVLVYATIALGTFIALEATLSFLGLGLRSPVVSWGVMIADSRQYIQTSPHLLFFPAAFLVVTVLAFVMLGDAVRDALDPKQK